MQSGDTIVALSSAAGAAARMIVRLSGPMAQALAARVSEALPVKGVHATRLRFNNLRIPAQIYAFSAPASYTGEDLIEFHLPGNPLVCRLLLDALIARGARHAEAGEFTARAYFNGKIDLTAAEGVAATIAANGEAELRAARQLMAGELARRLRPAMEQLAQALALVEVGIDFVEEDVTFISNAEVSAQVVAVAASLDAIVRESARFERLSHEPRVVFVGRPNAGKSTLLNALAGRDRAIVSPIAGTTRDALEAEVALRRGMIRLVDVAGIEALPDSATGPLADIERQMQARARAEIASADLVVLIQDGQSPNLPLDVGRAVDLIVETKVDLVCNSQRPAPTFAVSAKTGEHLPLLRERLDELAFAPSAERSTLALNARHRLALDEAKVALDQVAGSIPLGPELIAADLRAALDALGRILGDVTPDDLLGRIFSLFCIGK